MITLDKSKIILHQNGERKLIGKLENNTLTKRIWSASHSMNKSEEIGLNKEMIDTLPVKDIVISIMGKIYHTTKEEVLEKARVDHYANYEEQYFLRKELFTTI